MPRIADVDTVAPDDLSVEASAKADITSTPLPPRPIIKKKLKKIKKKKILTSADSTFRQRAYEILGHTRHPFSSFLVRPKVFSFEERDEDEEIILVLRRHWITNLAWIFIALLMTIAPAVFRSVPLLAYFPPSYQFIAVIFWYLITFAYAFEQFLSWYFNVCIITDERVVDIDFNNLLIKKFTDAKISMIQDVTSRVVGVGQTLFNYGTVLIQTAAEIPEICFEKIPNPEKVVKVLQQLRQEEEQEALEGRIR